jgi:hypothetical protein
MSGEEQEEEEEEEEEQQLDLPRIPGPRCSWSRASAAATGAISPALLSARSSASSSWLPLSCCSVFASA